MATMEMPARSAGISPGQLARIAGALYLIIIVAGFFTIGFVPATIFVKGDMAATAHNLQAHELLYRLGLLVHVVVLPLNVPLAVIFYDLFKVVSRRAALLVLFFSLVGTAVEGASLLNQFAPLTLLGSGPYSGALGAAQLEALAYLPLDLHTSSYSVDQVIYAFYILAAAYVVVRSTFLPRVVGLLLAIGAVSYLAYSFASFLAPGFAAHLVPYIQLPSLLGEGSLCLVLLVGAINVPRWMEQARATDTSVGIRAASSLA